MEKVLRLSIGVLMLLALQSCAAPPEPNVHGANAAPMQGPPAEPPPAVVAPTEAQAQPQAVAAQPSVEAAAPVAVQEGGPAPEVGQPPAAGPELPGRQIRLAQPSPALTETLSQILGLLEKEKAGNEQLRRELATLEQQLAEKDKTIAQLTLERDTFTEQLQTVEGSLGKWKQDVLGFRDEMRQAEEAEIEVLQQVLLILKTFQKEEVPQ